MKPTMYYLVSGGFDDWDGEIGEVLDGVFDGVSHELGVVVETARVASWARARGTLNMATFTNTHNRLVFRFWIALCNQVFYTCWYYTLEIISQLAWLQEMPLADNKKFL